MGLLDPALGAASRLAVHPVAVSVAASGPATRDGAADAARRELSRPEYDQARPPLLLRLLGRALRAVGHLFDSFSVRTPGQALVRGVLALLVVAVVVAVVARLGPLGARRSGDRALFDPGRPRTAADHRALAEQLAGQGRWADAVRERLRAVVRELEARGVLDPRPGRTAGEVARDAGAQVPGLAADLRRAAAVFDEVWYGGRDAGPQSYAVLVEVDDRVRAERTVLA